MSGVNLSRSVTGAHEGTSATHCAHGRRLSLSSPWMHTSCSRAGRGPVGGRSGWRVGVGRDRGQAVRGTRCGDVQADEPAERGGGVQEGGVGTRGRRSSGRRSSGAGRGGRHTCVAGVEMVGDERVALSLRVYQDRICEATTG